ncbi:MAG: TIGR04255 family protein [Methanothrix sp.]|nr:TIGR04255 family protein [Methanothrix sp.]
MAKYKKNFLSSVIIKIEFYDNLPINEELPQGLIDIATKNFPLFEPKPFIRKKYDFSNKGMKEAETFEGTNWIFHGKNREKSLTLEQAAVSIKYSKYSSFDDLKEHAQ